MIASRDIRPSSQRGQCPNEGPLVAESADNVHGSALANNRTFIWEEDDGLVALGKLSANSFSGEPGR